MTGKFRRRNAPRLPRKKAFETTLGIEEKLRTDGSRTTLRRLKRKEVLIRRGEGKRVGSGKNASFRPKIWCRNWTSPFHPVSQTIGKDVIMNNTCEEVV